MARPQTTPETRGLLSWDEVGARMDPPISAREARRIGTIALLKLRILLKLMWGIDEDGFREYLRLQERARSEHEATRLRLDADR